MLVCHNETNPVKTHHKKSKEPEGQLVKANYQITSLLRCGI